MKNGHPQNLKGYDSVVHVGKGGFGAVYKATQSSIGREVAVKVIKPEVANKPDFIRRFETEAQLIARLEHPHITPLYDYWRDTDGAYLVMRYLKGGSLYDTLRDEGAFELNAISTLLDQIASALDFAHRQQVIHRDIKPGNILLDEDGNAYLADFGIAKDLKIPTSHTSPDAVVGSLDYLSPEQARSEPVTPRTDIYSLGVVLYELVTGDHPFKEVSSVERLYKHINERLPEIEDLEGQSDDVLDNLNEIIQRATEKDPKLRYPDVLALAIAFREAIGRDDTQEELRVIEQLTMREHEVLQLVAEGLSNQEIADHLFVTKSNVRWHLRNAYKKLGVRGRVQAIITARELDLITTDRIADIIQADGKIISVTGVSLPEPENPYKGLHAFQTADARDFFGRDELADSLLQRLVENDPLKRFLAIVGPSGSGKSSLVRAGIVPRLWQGKIPKSEKWFVVDMIPGSRPLDELEIALTRVAANQSTNLHEHLSRDEFGIVRAAELILPKDDSQLVIVIDQFEEVFTLLNDEEARQHFLDLIYAATTDKRSRVYVIATLRADYYDRPLHYPKFGEMLRSRMDTILPLSAKGIERAVSGPAERVGVTFEAGLVAQIVSEMNYQAGALPLLQYALTELFDRREGRLLTHAAYTEIGGAVAALANRADEIFLHMPEEAQDLTQQLFLRMVTLGEGAEDTRRRTPFGELLSLSDNTDLVEEIIDNFADYRLLSLDHDEQTRQPTVEVAHEAILREWERLRQWLNESRDDIRQERQLAQATSLWETANSDESYLLIGERLKQIKNWATQTNIQLTPVEKTFIDFSVAKREALKEVELRREQLLRNMLYGLIAVLTIAAVVSTSFGFFAFIQRNIALRELEGNRSLNLAEAAVNESVGGATDLGLRLVLEAMSINNPPARTIEIFREITMGYGIRYTVPISDYALNVVAFSNDGRQVIVGGCASADEVCSEGQIIFVDSSTGDEINQFIIEQGDVHSLAWHPSASQLLVGTTSGEIMMMNPDNGEFVREYVDHDGKVNDLVFLGDGDTFLSAGEDGIIRLWDTNTGEILQIYINHMGFINNINTNNDQTLLVSAGRDNRAIVWDVETGEMIAEYTMSDEVLSALFISNSTNLVISGVSAELVLWDYAVDYLITTSQSGIIHSHLLSIGTDNTFYMDAGTGVDLYDIFFQNRSEFATRVNPTIITHITYHDSPSRIASVHENGYLTLIDLPNNGLIYQIDAGLSFDIAPDGLTLVSGAFYGRILVWDTETGVLLNDLGTIQVPVARVIFSPDGDYVVAGGGDAFSAEGNTALGLWDTETGELVWQTSDFEYLVRSVQFTPDGMQLIVGTLQFGPAWDYQEESGELILLDALTGERIRQYDYPFIPFEIAVSQMGDFFTIGAGIHDTNLPIWNINEENSVGGLVSPQTMGPYYVEFIKSDTELLIGGGNNAYRLNVESNEVLTRYRGMGDVVWHLSVSPNERYVAGIDTLGIISVWELDTGNLVRQYDHGGDGGWNVAFSPDGTTIFASAFDGRITRWQFEESSVSELLTWAQDNRYISDFTCEERQEYRIEPLCEDE